LGSVIGKRRVGKEGTYDAFEVASFSSYGLADRLDHQTQS